MDNRSGLANGYWLQLGETQYQIVEEIGRGASCIVYGASYQDTLGLFHNVRIKECYPICLNLERECKQNLCAEPSQMHLFAKEKEKFCEAYSKQVELQNTLGLINATATATQIYEQNQTIYIVMEMMEGCDYRERVDDSLMSVLIRIKAIAQVIAKYHEQGYLYLDLKPENVLIIPETKEHVVLFDFDAMARKEQLRSQPVRIACSLGFAAPEQVQGRIHAISEQTDIYAIGAMLYYKIFGTNPDIRQCEMHATYQWQKNQYASESDQPVLYRKLTEFLQHTMVTASVRRWQNMNQVIEKLNELILLSDTKRTFVYDNFQYHNQNFVGRQDEMETLNMLLNQQQTVFLHGIGGIGKTELARRYAKEYREQYDTVMFVTFQENIMDTVTSNEIKISHFYRDEKETKQDFFERKYNLLHEQLTSRDIMILDNFDVAEDIHLEKLLALPCKFIITSREDYRDYNYVQMEVMPMQEKEQLLTLFHTYNNIRYTSNETETIFQIMEIVEYHTMTIELIAKYLRDSEDTPLVLLKKLTQTKGIAEAKDTSLKHRKDQSLKAVSMYQHLRILFDISGFTKQERNLLQCLALLGSVRVQKDLFMQWYTAADAKQQMIHLTQKGWLVYEETTGMLSLHQIVLDLIYNEWKMDDQELEPFVLAMRNYVCQKAPNSVERDIKRRLLKIFVSRIEGESVVLATLYLAYCFHIRNDEKLLDKVECICEHLQNKSEVELVTSERLSEQQTEKKMDERWQAKQQMEKRIYEQLQAKQQIEKRSEQLVWICKRELCYLRISKQLQIMEDAALLTEDEDAVWLEGTDKIVAFAKQAEQYQEQIDKSAVAYAIEKSHLANVTFYLRLGKLLDEIVGRLEVYFYGEEETVLKKLCTQAAYFYQKAENIMGSIDTVPDDAIQAILIKSIKALQQFYEPDDYCAMYRSEHYGNDGKVQYYKKMLEQVKQYNSFPQKRCEDKITEVELEETRLPETELTEIELTETGLVELELTEIELTEQAAYYEATSEFEKAKTCLLKLLAWDKSNGYHIAYTCQHLCQFLLRRNKTNEALKYCEEVIAYCEERVAQYIFTKDNIENTITLQKSNTNVCKNAEAFENEMVLQEQNDVNQENIRWLLVFYSIKYNLQNREEQQHIFQKTEKLLQFYTGARIDIAPYVHMRLQHDQQEGIIQKKTINLVCDTVEEYLDLWQNDKAEELLDNILPFLSNCPEIQIALWLDKYLIYDRKADYEQALECCQKAEQLLSYMTESASETNISQQPWWYHNILQKMGDAYYHLQKEDKAEEIRRKCNYFYLAEEQCKREKQKKEFTLQEQAAIWEDAAHAYQMLDKYELAKQCYEQLLKQLEPQKDLPLYFEIQQKCITVQMALAQEEQVYKMTADLCRQLLCYYTAIENKLEHGNVCVKQMQDMAHNYASIACREEALLLYLLAFLVYVAKQTYDKVLQWILGEWENILPCGAAVMDLLLSDKKATFLDIVINESVKALQQTDYTKQEVDVIVGMFEKILPFLKEIAPANRIADAYQTFAKNCVYYEIVFKR